MECRDSWRHFVRCLVQLNVELWKVREEQIQRSARVTYYSLRKLFVLIFVFDVKGASWGRCQLLGKHEKISIDNPITDESSDEPCQPAFYEYHHGNTTVLKIRMWLFMRKHTREYKTPGVSYERSLEQWECGMRRWLMPKSCMATSKTSYSTLCHCIYAISLQHAI